MGEALAFGRALHKADRDFGAWCNAEGFGDIDRRCRADAMWLASVSNDWTPTSSHPTAIRAEFNAQQPDTPPSPSLTIEAPTRLTASIEQVAPQAKRINKLVSMAERGEGQERETAQKYLKGPQRGGKVWGKVENAVFCNSLISNRKMTLYSYGGEGVNRTGVSGDSRTSQYSV